MQEGERGDVDEVEDGSSAGGESLERPREESAVR
jgi:hypothetical protein